jgi:hypothetical protein
MYMNEGLAWLGMDGNPARWAETSMNFDALPPIALTLTYIRTIRGDLEPYASLGLQKAYSELESSDGNSLRFNAVIL